MAQSFDPQLVAIVKAFGDAQVTQRCREYDPIVQGWGVVDRLVGMSADAFQESLRASGYQIVPLERRPAKRIAKKDVLAGL